MLFRSRWARLAIGRFVLKYCRKNNMINHARTLLMNIHPLRANYADDGYTGYEYVPAEFVPVQLPPAAAAVRRALFGANPDGLFCGLRAHELLSYIHETELAEYVYKLDPRVTYWPAMQDSRYTLDKPRITIRQTLGAPRRIAVAGELREIGRAHV